MELKHFPFHFQPSHITQLLEQIQDVHDDQLKIILYVTVLTTSTQFDIHQDFRKLLQYLLLTHNIDLDLRIQQWIYSPQCLPEESYRAYYLFGVGQVSACSDNLTLKQ